MKKIVLGLTGSTGAGKSTVAKELEASGLAIIDADRISRLVTEKGSPVLDTLAVEFGKDIIKADGNLDRKLLAKRAFADKKSSEKLNAIVHPAVMDIIKKRVDDNSANGISSVIDAPLLFEAGGDKLCEKVIAVIAPLETRLKRIMERDSIDFDAAMLRINAQKPDEFYTQKADFAVANDRSEDELKAEIKKIISTLLEDESIEQ